MLELTRFEGFHAWVSPLSGVRVIPCLSFTSSGGGLKAIMRLNGSNPRRHASLDAPLSWPGERHAWAPPVGQPGWFHAWVSPGLWIPIMFSRISGRVVSAEARGGGKGTTTTKSPICYKVNKISFGKRKILRGQKRPISERKEIFWQ